MGKKFRGWFSEVASIVGYQVLPFPVTHGTCFWRPLSGAFGAGFSAHGASARRRLPRRRPGAFRSPRGHWARSLGAPAGGGKRTGPPRPRLSCAAGLVPLLIRSAANQSELAGPVFWALLALYVQGQFPISPARHLGFQTNSLHTLLGPNMSPDIAKYSLGSEPLPSIPLREPATALELRKSQFQ